MTLPVALLTDREYEIGWRAAAMRAHAGDRRPRPFLMAVPDLAPAAGRCVSCPAPVDADLERARCSWCALAVARVLTDLRAVGYAEIRGKTGPHAGANATDHHVVGGDPWP